MFSTLIMGNCQGNQRAYITRLEVQSYKPLIQVWKHFNFLVRPQIYILYVSYEIKKSTQQKDRLFCAIFDIQDLPQIIKKKLMANLFGKRLLCMICFLVERKKHDTYFDSLTFYKRLFLLIYLSVQDPTQIILKKIIITNLF